MSEFSFPPNTTHHNKSKKSNLFSHFLSYLFLFSSSIISHPLYFFYFIFFSPYIFKIFSFLSPLFITTSLLLLALFITFFLNDDDGDDNSSPSESSENSNVDDVNGKSLSFEDLEAYKMVFDVPIIATTEIIKEDEVSDEKTDKISASEAPIDKHMLIAEVVKSAEAFLLKEDDCDDDDFVDMESEKSEKEVKPAVSGAEQKFVRSSSKGMSKMRVMNSQRLGGGGGDDHHLWCDDESDGASYGSSLGSYGSMRKEKEWRRTLACKLFEERHNNNSSNNNNNVEEGMDMLWETYEADSNKQQEMKKLLLSKSKTKKGKNWSKKYELNEGEEDDDGDDDGDEIDDDVDDGKLCCLQALKFSTGKMNLGMRRPNLVKISKVFKGIGWLHNVTKHGKKIYH